MSTSERSIALISDDCAVGLEEGELASLVTQLLSDELETFDAISCLPPEFENGPFLQRSYEVLQHGYSLAASVRNEYKIPETSVWNEIRCRLTKIESEMKKTFN